VRRCPAKKLSTTGFVAGALGFAVAWTAEAAIATWLAIATWFARVVA